MCRCWYYIRHLLCPIYPEKGFKWVQTICHESLQHVKQISKHPLRNCADGLPISSIILQLFFSLENPYKYQRENLFTRIDQKCPLSLWVWWDQFLGRGAITQLCLYDLNPNMFRLLYCIFYMLLREGHKYDSGKTSCFTIKQRNKLSPCGTYKIDRIVDILTLLILLVCFLFSFMCGPKCHMLLNSIYTNINVSISSFCSRIIW